MPVYYFARKATASQVTKREGSYGNLSSCSAADGTLNTESSDSSGSGSDSEDSSEEGSVQRCSFLDSLILNLVRPCYGCVNLAVFPTLFPLLFPENLLSSHPLSLTSPHLRFPLALPLHVSLFDHHQTLQSQAPCSPSTQHALIAAAPLASFFLCAVGGARRGGSIPLRRHCL